MDFRIRNIKNHDSLPMQRQTEPMLSVLRELAQVIRLSHQHFIDAQKERIETKQVLLQIKSSLDKKEQVLNTVSQEIKKILDKTVKALTDICQKISMHKGQGKTHQSEQSCKIEENQKSNIQQKLSWSGFEKKSEQILNNMEEISVTPAQPRNIQVTVNSSRKKSENTEKNIKSYVAKVSNKVFSVSFNMFFKEKIDFEKIKAYCSENMLGNLIEMVKQKRTTADQIQMIDQHLSSMVLPYLKLNYPHSEEKEISSKLASLVVEKDIFNQNRFDILYGSPIESMTWHGLQQKDKNNDGKKTQKQFMRLVNYIIKLPDQPTSSSEKTLFESFQQDMTKCFQIIFNKDLTQLINNGDQKILSQHIKGGNLDSVATLLERIGKSINFVQKDQKLNHQNQKEISQYREKVKSYTKYKIGRKISANSKPFKQSQIQKGTLSIKDQAIRRIMTKWIQSLQQVLQNPLDFTILRNELLKLYDGTQNNNEGVEQKEILLALLKNESVKVKKTYGQIKKNLYETFRESIINQQYQKFDSQFCSQRQAFVGNTSTILSGATERYIFEYLIVLINSLKKAEKDYYNKSFTKPQNERKPLLVNFKLGDLMRCQLSSKESEVITIYKFLILLCEKIPDKFELVRVKNRFNGPNKDILINIWYHKTIMVEIQLAIKNESPFLECSDKYSHFIYELRRDILGPISELASVWNKFSPKAEFFEKQYKLKLRKCIFSQNVSNTCKKQTHLFMQNMQQTGLPFWCSNCKVFQVSEQLKIECRNCNKRICSMCRNTEQISKQYSDKKFELNLDIGKTQRGMLLKGVEIKTKEVKFYFFMEFMGKMVIVSFKSSKSAFTEIQTKFEQSDKQTQNESNLQYFISQNYLILDNCTKIDEQALIGQIFAQFWQRRLTQIEIKKKSVFAIILFSKPSLNKQEKKKIVEKIMKKNETNKMYLSIEKLNISQNEVQQIKLINKFKNIKQINLNKNKIKTLEGASQLSLLQQINLQQNQLQSLKGLPCLSNLKKINLNNNKINTLEGTPQLPLLQQMHLQSNQLQSVQGLPCLISLKKINLTNNKIKKLYGIPQLPLLQQIHLKHNHLQSVKELPCLVNLKKIYLDRNKINTLQATPQLPKLQFMYLSFNLLQSLKGLPCLMNLKKVDLNSNKINTLEKTPQLPLLYQMNIQQNQLQSLKGLPSLSNLKKINLNKNKINTLEGTPQLPLLQDLNLQQNQLYSLKGLPCLSNLRKMYLTNNKIKTLEGTPQLPLLQQINLQQNQLQSLKGLPSLSNLKKINLNKNKIKTFQGTPQLPLLQLIYLQSNLLQSLKRLPCLNNLKKIHLYNNKINSLEGISQLPLLQQIYLQQNQLQSLKGLPCLSNLKKINLNNNKINTLEGTPQLPLLQQMHLQSNQLQSVQGLPCLISLKKINLSYNNINALEGAPQLPFLDYFDINENPINSDPNISQKIYCIFPSLK